MNAEQRTLIEQTEQRWNTKFDRNFEALMARLDERCDRTEQRMSAFEHQMSMLKPELSALLAAQVSVFRMELGAELARHVKAISEEMRPQFSAIDDKYADLPGRVRRLEKAVFRPRRR